MLGPQKPQPMHTFELICSQFIPVTHINLSDPIGHSPVISPSPVIIPNVNLGDGANYTYVGCHM